MPLIPHCAWWEPHLSPLDDDDDDGESLQGSLLSSSLFLRKESEREKEREREHICDMIFYFVFPHEKEKALIKLGGFLRGVSFSIVLTKQQSSSAHYLSLSLSGI
jgi:hypothetical protein